MKPTRKTAGELTLKAKADDAKYDPLEVAYAMTDDIYDNLMLCARNHEKIIDEPEFCIVLVLADDPLIKGILRRKFYAWPYLPSPRPRQACFLYKKATQSFKRLWVLPDAATMAHLSESITVDKKWKTMKAWSDAFYRLQFWEFIRKEHNIDLLSEIEYLNRYRNELIKAGAKEVNPGTTHPFDFSKVAVEKIIDTKTAVSDENTLDGFRKA